MVTAKLTVKLTVALVRVPLSSNSDWGHQMRKLASLTFAGAMALAAAGLATSANATNFVGLDTVTA